MKNLQYLTVFLIVFIFMFSSCGQNLDIENTASGSLSSEGNDNDKGEEGNAKKPTIVDQPETEDNIDGVFILTDIPSQFIGKHAIFRAYTGDFASTVVYGFNNVTKDTDAYHLHMVEIDDSKSTNVYSGILKMPVWNYSEHGNSERERIITYSQYLGNHTFGYTGVIGSADPIIEIYDFSAFPVSTKSYGYIDPPPPLAVIKFPSITFSNGSVVKSYNDGKVNILSEAITASFNFQLEIDRLTWFFDGSTDYERIYIRRPGEMNFVSIESNSQPGSIQLGKLGLIRGENTIKVISVGKKLKNGNIVDAESAAAEFIIRIDEVVNRQLTPPSGFRIEDGWQLLWTVDNTVYRVGGKASHTDSGRLWIMDTINLTNGINLSFLASVSGEVIVQLASFTNFPITLQNHVLTNTVDSNKNFPNTSVRLYVTEDGIIILS